MRDDALDEMSRGVKYGNVLDAGFGMFREMLRYKLARQGKAFITIDRYLPTTRTCSACGLIQDDGVNYKRRTWECPVCGVVHSREVNAAKNIKNQGLIQYFERQEMRESA